MPSLLIQCDVCRLKYARNHYRSSATCLLCVLQQRLAASERNQDDLAKQHNDLARKHSDLTKEFDALKEFVASNVGCSTGDVMLYATAAASAPAPANAAHDPTVSVPAPDASRPVIPPPPCRDSGTAAFTPVRNGRRPATKSFLPIQTFNRFAVLAEEEEEPFETSLIGDSIVRGQLEEFCGRARATRKRLCMPGGRLDDITAVCDEATTGSANNTLFIIHAGTNDVLHTRSEELMEKYKRMIRTFKTKTNNIVISGILPRIQAPDRFYSKAFSTNNRLKQLCSQEDVDFINMWDDFYNQRDLFRKDGLHLSDVGSARFGRLISGKVSLFRPKNEARPASAGST